MKLVFAFLALLAVVTASELISENKLEFHFNLFKTQFGRNYVNAEEEILRKSIFAKNLEYILKHNREYLEGRSTYDLALNKFSDLTNDEFRARFTGYRNSGEESPAPLSTYSASNVQNLPKTVDWRRKNAVTPVKNQGDCGSCWAFSAVASMEGQYAVKTGKLVSLSEQQLIDCSRNNLGCIGGLMDRAFKYVIESKGMDTEEAYNYEEMDGDCRFKEDGVGATFSGFIRVRKGSEISLQSAVASFGPVSVAIDAASTSFKFYNNGVYNPTNCSSDHLDHALTVVGYGSRNGSDYWLVKNSWGLDWGEDGYILMSRNKKNQCGIATDASWPVV